MKERCDERSEICDERYAGGRREGRGSMGVHLTKGLKHQPQSPEV
jgi:hypothetical protein